ncbi:unnamed protein product [Rotaria sp. Silwood2]|nr:unnamed protein product [Rotaria sp. Silwood2]CAF2855177.1 unnamed protein product [Rotaria sp. Silwood2]CAF4280945.1 unnamed protein product [Rotaria sp. Silwood2]CAF4428351.1 unnamed protein product [Rotaria sp. Silwood2]CAF4754610.1 unnamed protein product [Rotaria sp. Silwood2]
MALIAIVNNRQLTYTSLLTPGVVPPSIGSFKFNTLNTVVFDIGTLIPNTAQQLSVTVFIRSGYDSNSPYNVWLWTEFGNNQKDIKFKRGYRYPQSAISFDSETFNFAYSSNHPKLYLMSDVTAETGNMFLELFAVGYAQ